MKVGLAQCVNKGMQRDHSMDKASQEFAYENRNIRITTTGNESFLSVTNERSTIPYTPIKVSLGLVSTVDTDKMRWDFFVRALSGTDESVNVTVEFKDINNNIIESKDFSLVKHDTFSYHTNIKAVKATVRSVNAIVTNYSASTNVEIINNCEYIDSSIIGTVIGSTTLGDYLVLFTKDEETNIDFIYKINCSDASYLSVIKLYEGNLNFDVESPIECITSYEGDEVLKVYWVDGIHQPRVINICNTYESSFSFDFTPNIPDAIDVTIEKEYNGSGSFPTGVIQYFVTLYNKFSSETCAAYESPLYYISAQDRGGNADEVQTCNFKITINQPSKGFEYARVYSLMRTSLNSTPQAYIVEDIKLGEDGTAIVIDTNTLNTPIAPTDIMFLGGNTIIASTIEQKDNTLFLGNISEVSTDVTSSIKSIENKGTLSFGSKFVPSKISNNEYYQYTPNLDLSSRDIKTFKFLEWYKIGIQFQLQSGEWSSVIELGDIQNTVMPNTRVEETPYEDIDNLDGGVWLPALSFAPSEDLLKALEENPNIKSWRLVMAEHSPETRTIKTQGLVIPTIFNLQERVNETCYASPLWTLNTALFGEHLGSIDLDYVGNDTEGSAQYSFEMYPYFHMPTAFYREKEGKYYKLNSVIKSTVEEEYSDGNYYLTSVQPIIAINRYTEYIPPWGFDIRDKFTCNVRLGVKSSASDAIDYYDVEIYNTNVPAGNRRSSLKELSKEIQKTAWLDIWDSSIGSIKVSALNNIIKTDTIFKPDEIPSGNSLRDDYGVKPANDITIPLSSYLRDIVYTEETEILRNYGNQYFLDANICNFISPNVDNITKDSKFRIVGYTDISNSISDYSIDVEDSTIGTTTYRYPIYNVNTLKMRVFPRGKFLSGITSFPLWPYLNKLYYINYWHNGGNIVSDKFNLKSKKFANMWYCTDTTYTYPITYGSVNELATVENETVLIDSKVYKSKYQNVLFSKSNAVSFIGGGSESDPPYKQPVNETTPLNKVIEAIEDTDSTEPLVETVDAVGAVDIKHNSARHAVFKLPAKKGFFGILPNYTPTKEGNSFVYSDTIYPVGVRDVDYIFYVYNPSSAVIKDDNYDGKVSVALYENSISIYSPKSDVDIRANYTGTSQVQACIPDKYQCFKQPTFNEIVLDIREVGVDNRYYKGKTWLIKLQGRNDFLLIKQYGGFIINDSTILFEGTAKIVSGDDPVSIYDSYNDIHYSVNNYVEDNNSLSVDLYKLSMFQIPNIQDSRYNSEKPKLFIGEFYVDYDKNTFFGGNSQNCKFIPISEAYPKTTTKGWGFEGDTYYQRCDNVRIYESNSSDVNQNIDAVSFMLETYENLDGDYRMQRGRLDTINLTVENTNDAINPVYSQSNNYTASYILDKKLDDSTHPTLYAWSLTKQILADIDTWTSINLVNSIKLDGDKGVLNKIKRWNNNLLAFQDKGIAVINFNQQTTISTSEGVPVEIANSGKVTGHYYLSSNQGCTNKWSIIDSPYGIYFIDSYNKSINVFSSEGIKSLSTINLFQDWTVENEKGITWNPTNNGGFKSFYDPIHKEVYFINDVTALCYNELLGQFTSFYDYDKLNSMIPLNGSIYGIREGEVYKMFSEEADYCNLFGKPVEYSMTYKINKDSYLDKIWTNLEYRADVFNRGNITNHPVITDDTFDTLEVWNEYQKGVAYLKGNKYPNAKCKFRTWRADIPRDSKSKRDRIRNPWIMFKLEKTSNTNKRMEFHDLVVKYLQ